MKNTTPHNRVPIAYMALPIIVFLVLQACRPETKPYVVMLSVDGFRWDYPDKFNTPNLDRIEKKGGGYA